MLDLKRNVTSIYTLIIGQKGLYSFHELSGEDSFDDLDDVRFLSTKWLTFSFLPQFPNTLLFVHEHSDRVLCVTIDKTTQIEEDTPRSIIDRSQKVFVLATHEQLIESLCISHTGRYIAAGAKNEIHVWRVLSKEHTQLVYTTNAHRISSILEFVNVGDVLTLATGSKREQEDEEMLHILQIDPSDVEKQVELQKVPVEGTHRLTYLKNANPLDMFVTANEHGNVHFWELATNGTIKSLLYSIYLQPHCSHLYEIVFFGFESPTEDEQGMTIRHIVVMATGDPRTQKGALCFYDGIKLVLEYAFDSPVVYCCLANDFDERHLIACCQDGTGFVWPVLDIVNAIFTSHHAPDVPSFQFDDVDTSRDSSTISIDTISEPEQEIDSHVVVPPTVTITKAPQIDHSMTKNQEDDEEAAVPRKVIPQPHKPVARSIVKESKTNEPVPQVQPPKPRKKKIAHKPYNFGNPSTFINTLVEYHKEGDKPPAPPVLPQANGTSRLLEREIIQRMEDKFDPKHAQKWLETKKKATVSTEPPVASKALNHDLHERVFTHLTPITKNLEKKKLIVDKASPVPVVLQKRAPAPPPPPAPTGMDAIIASTIEANLSRKIDKQLQEDWEQEEDCTHDDFVCHISKLKPQSQRVTDTLFIKEYLLAHNMLL